MKVLITGNKGLVGSCLSSYLRKRGYEVFELDCDIRDKDRIFSSFDDHFKWDWIIHAAAKTDVDECQKDPQTCFDINVNGTNNIQELAKHHNTFLIYISTVSVFDGLVGNYTEKDAPTPINVYSLSKFKGEEIVKEYSRGFIVRTNIIGVHSAQFRVKNFFEWLMHSIQINNNFVLFNDVRINPLSQWTLAMFIHHLIIKPPPTPILHFGSKNVMTKAEIGHYVLSKHPSFKGKIDTVSVDEKSKNIFRPKEMWLNCDATEKLMNIKMPALEDEIDKILEQKGTHIEYR